MTAAQIAQLAISLLPLVQTGVTEFVAWLETLRTAARQTAEWTPDQDAAFTSALYAKTNDPRYQPDPPAAP